MLHQANHDNESIQIVRFVEQIFQCISLTFTHRHRIYRYTLDTSLAMKCDAITLLNSLPLLIIIFYYYYITHHHINHDFSMCMTILIERFLTNSNNQNMNQRLHNNKTITRTRTRLRVVCENDCTFM